MSATKENITSVNVTVGKNIKFYRMCAKLTRSELAQSVGLSTRCISDIEIGKRDADSIIIIRIAKALNVRPMNLIINPTDGVTIVHGHMLYNAD